MLRCANLGLHTSDLDEMSYGMVLDMLSEKANDQEEYPIKGTDQDIKRLFG